MLLPHFSEQVSSALPTISSRHWAWGVLCPQIQCFLQLLFSLPTLESLGRKGPEYCTDFADVGHTVIQNHESTHQRHLRTVHGVYWR